MISVCMPTYNGATYIKAQIESILVQLRLGDELIISDNGSIDNTLSLIQEFRDPRIHLLKHQSIGDNVRKNIINNVEFLLKKTKGDIIFLADQDDIWLPNKIKETIETLGVYDVIISDAIVIDENNQQLYPSYIDLNHSKIGFWNGLLTNPYLGCAMAFKRKVLEKALPFPKNIPMHDSWLGAVGEVFFKVGLIDEPLIQYRRHGNNASTSGSGSTYFFWKKIGFRYQIIIGIIKRYTQKIVTGHKY